MAGKRGEFGMNMSRPSSNSTYALLAVLLTVPIVYASEGLPSSGTENKTSELTAPPDKSLVCIYRSKSLVGAAVPMRVMLDGSRGVIGPGSFLVKVVEPGAHVVLMEMPPPNVSKLTAMLAPPKPPIPANVSFDTKPGETYFLRATPETGFATNRIAQRFDPPEVAAKTLAESHRVEWLVEGQVPTQAPTAGAISNWAPGIEHGGDIPAGKRVEVLGLAMSASEALKTFTALAAKGDVDGLIKAMILPQGTDEATARTNLSEKLIPFFSDFDRIGNAQVVHPATYPFLDNREGVNLYVFAVTKTGSQKPFVVGFVPNGQNALVAYLDVGHCVKGSHYGCQ